MTSTTSLAAVRHHFPYNLKASTMQITLIHAGRRFLVASLITVFSGALPTVAAQRADLQLVVPATLINDLSLPKAQADAQILAARRYDTFWSNGDATLAHAALAPNFMDRTLPPGRQQGIAGPLAASAAFHSSVPDLHCDVVQMIVSGDRVVAHMRFTGHFTGAFHGTHGHGQRVDFIATDIYRIADGQITDNWHLEDNLTFLQQIGLAAQ